MKVKGSATLQGPVDEVWAKLRDPQVLVRTIPGCQRLEETAEDEYRITLTAGVASIKGTYSGTVRLTDPQPPRSFVLRASAAGTPGTVDATVAVSLSGDGNGATRVDYDADAVVGGMVAGVGQRLLSSAAGRTAAEFFRNVDAAPGPGEQPWDEQDPAQAEASKSAAERPPAAGVFERPAPAATPGDGPGEFVKGAVAGAAIALAGVIVGGLLARRSGRR
jgi:uncharacterized protein